MAKKKAYENLEHATSISSISPTERGRELRELELRRMSVASAMEVLLDDYRKSGGKHAPSRRKKIGKAKNDYRA